MHYFFKISRKETCYNFVTCCDKKTMKTQVTTVAIHKQYKISNTEFKAKKVFTNSKTQAKLLQVKVQIHVWP